MKNKVKLKNFLFKICLLIIIIVSLFIIINMIEYHNLTQNFNNKLSSIVSSVTEKYPDLSEDEIMNIINSSESSYNIFEKYNIDINKDTVILENNKVFIRFIIIDSIFLCLTLVLLIILFIKYNKKRDKELNEITRLIEEINKKNYKLNLDEISEDELSILKNEIYKTTIMLKEQAENSKKEKLELKESLSDISHQLKTPLTSILIILDNLIEDAYMDVQTRQDFIFDIKREINNINFLVQSLLKLSKLDTNNVTFVKENIEIKEIIEQAVKKLSMLCDLKDVKINVNCKNNIMINTDVNWQVEAISNVLKNAIEHSKENAIVGINIDDKKLYSEITITDYGDGIDKQDLSHIFERFYKGKNSSKDSIGIGLALAKTIIEKSNGKIIVESRANEGTTFIIRYYQI